MTIFAASAADPYIISSPGKPQSLAYRNKDSRVQVHPGLVAGEATGVFVTAGQSNGAGANHVVGTYTPTNARNHTLNVFDGGVYQTADPLLGGGGTNGSWGGRLADKLIDDGVFDRVILIPTDVGGSAISEWVPGAAFFDRLIVATRRAKAVGLSVSGYLWHQGESDQAAGTSQATYQVALASIIAGVRAYGAEFQAPWFVGLCSYNAGNTSAGVRAAQAAVVNGVDIYQGGDTDALSGGNRAGDNLHFSTTGADAAADLWKVPLANYF